MPPGAFLVFIIFRFFLGHLPQTPGFRSARQILAVSFATRARNCILSDLNMFYTPRGGRTTAGSNAPGAFLVLFFFWWSLAPDLRLSLGQTNTRRVFRYTGKAFTLSDHNIVYNPPGERTTAGSNAPGAFLVFHYFPFFWWSVAPDLRFLLGQTYSSRLSLHSTG